MIKKTDRYILLAFVVAITIFALSNVICFAIKGNVFWVVFHSVFLACDIGLLVWQIYLFRTARKRDEKYVKQFVKKNLYDEVMNSAARNNFTADKKTESKDDAKNSKERNTTDA